MASFCWWGASDNVEAKARLAASPCSIYQPLCHCCAQFVSLRVLQTARIDKYTSVYYVWQSQKVATGYVNSKIHKEAVKIDTINATTDIQNNKMIKHKWGKGCLLYTSPSPRDRTRSRMPSSA